MFLTTFIQMPTVPYNRMYQRPQQIMKKLSENGYTIYYIDNILGDYIVKINRNLYEVGALYKINMNVLSKPIILWCSHPENINRIKNIYHDYVVFDIIDDYSYEFKSWNVNLKDMFKVADIVFTSSYKLYNKFFLKHSKTYLIRNGVDFNSFSINSKFIPKDLPRNKNIIGYVGALASWIDWNLIDYICKIDCNIVFIGPIIGNIDIKLNENLYLLGEKKYNELPFYISNFDCCIIPFRVNKMTNSCNPIKLYEYLAMGKPVVSSNIEEVKKLKSLCYISENYKQFAENLNKAIHERNQELIFKRKNFALNNSWSKRVNDIILKLEENSIL